MSRHHAAWANGGSRRARARLAPTLPAPCSKCAKPVLPGTPWDVDHTVPLDRWPEGLDYPPHLLQPSHRSCNRAEGGRISIARLNAMKRAKKNAAQGLREW
ncbi:HNH endonuclease [Curtobacterium sp. MCPF17_052]|uniref:HNH endonuclease n=1 Tax=Curtobacterium sp. MCPF17_052 TaxID=2175655 RepID=UPI003463A69A